MGVKRLLSLWLVALLALPMQGVVAQVTNTGDVIMEVEVKWAPGTPMVSNFQGAVVYERIELEWTISHGSIDGFQVLVRKEGEAVFSAPTLLPADARTYVYEPIDTDTYYEFMLRVDSDSQLYGGGVVRVETPAVLTPEPLLPVAPPAPSPTPAPSGGGGGGGGPTGPTTPTVPTTPTTPTDPIDPEETPTDGDPSTDPDEEPTVITPVDEEPTEVTPDSPDTPDDTSDPSTPEEGETGETGNGDGTDPLGPVSRQPAPPVDEQEEETTTTTPRLPPVDDSTPVEEPPLGEIVVGDDIRIVYSPDVDSDGDGLSDWEEYLLGTNPFQWDGDGDGISDLDEIMLGTDPARWDTDEDGFADGVEVRIGTNPLDTNDFPLMNEYGVDEEWWEEYYTNRYPDGLGEGVTFGTLDSDGDGLSDLLEYYYGTDPFNPDTDGDGFTDGQEVLDDGTDPLDSEDNRDTAGLRITNLHDGETSADPHPFVRGLVPRGTTQVEVLYIGDFGTVILDHVVLDSERRFYATNTDPLDNGRYRIILRAYDAQGNLMGTTAPIRITIDTSIDIGAPIPQQLAGQLVTDINLLSNVTISVKDRRPTVEGEVYFGSTVIAVFHSVVYSSSLIADNEMGRFAITAPAPLELGPHEVFLYAENRELGVKSRVIRIPFEIVKQEEPTPADYFVWSWWWIVPAALLLLLLLWLVWWRRRKKEEDAVEEPTEVVEEVPTASSTSPAEEPSAQGQVLFRNE